MASVTSVTSVTSVVQVFYGTRSRAESWPTHKVRLTKPVIKPLPDEGIVRELRIRANHAIDLARLSR